MSARVLAESALRVSDCVTELLRKQPFFGSLVLRLPLRPDATRETLATDGHEIRYSPRWVAETDSHLIETAMARVVIHDSAIKRVTRTFAASLSEAFAEILQNSRRAGATRVRVAVAGSDADLAVTVTDDGLGLADPAVLLSFGENGWSEDLVRREDAAGMGMLSLARRGCTVSSRPRSTDGDPTPGWRVALLPEHFLGEADAAVEPDDAAPWPHGTAVTFPATETVDTIRHAIGSAAWHYPFPVVFEHAPETPAGGEVLERRAFLDGSLRAERWRGLVFGVFRDRWAGFGLNDPDVNFHGLTVTVRLPAVEAVTGARWTVGADIVDCPELELVLPARKEPVETPFLEEMREAARLAIYRAMAADADPRPSFEDWQRARDAGIDIAPPPAELRPWRPGLADIENWQERRTTGIPLILDESATDVGVVLRAKEDGVLDGLNVKLARVGGISKMRLIRDLCVALNVPMEIQDSSYSDLACAVVAHIGHSTPERCIRSVIYPKGLKKATVIDGPTVKGGRITAPDGPGIGAVPMLDVIGDSIAVYE